VTSSSSIPTETGAALTSSQGASLPAAAKSHPDVVTSSSSIPTEIDATLISSQGTSLPAAEKSYPVVVTSSSSIPTEIDATLISSQGASLLATPNSHFDVVTSSSSLQTETNTTLTSSQGTSLSANQNSHPVAKNIPFATITKDSESKREPQREVHKTGSIKDKQRAITSEGVMPHGEQNSQAPLSSQKKPCVEDIAQTPFTLKTNYKVLSREEKSVLPAEKTIDVSSLDSKPFEDKNRSGVLCSSRTTVIASLIDRKLGPRRKTSIVPKLATRKSRVFNDSEARIQGMPLTIEQFNRYRNYIEKVTLKSTVRTEVRYFDFSCIPAAHTSLLASQFYFLLGN
jgi:hypothetical protein